MQSIENTIIPSVTVIFVGLDPTRILIISQAILSFGLPFAAIPLIRFTAKKKVMSNLVNKKITTVTACLSAAIIVGLNMYLLHQTFIGGK